MTVNFEYKNKIIDAHAHVVQYIAGFTSRGELRAAGGGRAAYADGTSFEMIPARMGDCSASPEALIAEMDENGVDKAVLLQGQFFGFQNEYTAEAVRKYPSRFVGAASYDMFCRRAEDIKRHLFGELGFKIVKFEVSDGSGLMAYRPAFALDGEEMTREYAYAADHGLTVVVDIGRPGSCCWQPEALASAAKRFSSLTFVVCHLLAPRPGDGELLKSALGRLALPNVYFDLASLPTNQRPKVFPYPSAVEHLKTAKAVVGADRLMFGTDMPSNLCRDSYAHLKDYIAEGGVFTPEELSLIFRKTAERVYFS